METPLLQAGQILGPSRSEGLGGGAESSAGSDQEAEAATALSRKGGPRAGSVLPVPVSLPVRSNPAIRRPALPVPWQSGGPFQPAPPARRVRQLPQVRALKRGVSGVSLIKAAILVQAMSGNGCDRHLLGLKLMAESRGLKVPEFLKHATYSQMNHLRLSTSQVPSRFVAAIAFGQIVPDGYGIFYNPQEDNITFSISASNSCEQTSAENFAFSLQKCMVQLRRLFK